MNDDDKQQSYERLDETNPERNHRSFFDWLRGKEETDEEKLRKKLDEELKEAARKRATEFEEEQRIEEQREVAETRKLKKRWRTKLVEKSKKLLEEAAERGNEPTSGYEIARLMVAERIVKLHDILTTEDLRKSEMKSLKIHIDFMGLLSEKLDRPELEVPEEVERLYETIAASVEETTGEVVPMINGKESEPAPISESDAAYTVFAASIVQAIRRAVQLEQPPSAVAHGKERSVGSSPTPIPVTERPSDPIEQQSQGSTEQLMAIVMGAALSGEAIKHEISQSEHARKLADVAEKAAMVDRFVVSHETPRTTVPEQESEPDEELRHSKGFNLPPNRKIKHMTDLELVHLAETVQLDGGRLLSDIYKKGEIDREGLIKVLESYNKGLDYRSEFTIRRDKWRRHTQESQEYLTRTPPPVTAPPTIRKATEQESGIPEYRPTPSRGSRGRVLRNPVVTSRFRNIGFNRATLKEVGRNVSETKLIQAIKERAKRQSQVALLVISLSIVVIVVVAVIELNSL